MGHQEGVVYYPGYSQLRLLLDWIIISQTEPTHLIARIRPCITQMKVQIDTHTSRLDPLASSKL